MDVPMVLPCGQFIDRKNLDKYIENEEKFEQLDIIQCNPYDFKQAYDNPILHKTLEARFGNMVMLVVKSLA